MICVNTGIEISNPQKVAYVLILRRISKGKLRETLHLSSFSLTQSLQLCPTLCDLWAVAHQAPLWDSSGKNTGVGGHVLLQGIFPTQEFNPYLLHLLHCKEVLYPLSHLGSPVLAELFLWYISKTCTFILKDYSVCLILEILLGSRPKISFFNQESKGTDFTLGSQFLLFVFAKHPLHCAMVLIFSRIRNVEGAFSSPSSWPHKLPLEIL